MSFKKYLVTNKEYVENFLDEYLSSYTYPEVIAQGMKYAVLNGGKRVRPILLFMILDLFKVNKDMGLKTAAAIEMIHSYSLVHDDLPALDNDDYRRGKLTTHKKFGEANGILIGDALLTNAFYLLSTQEMNAEKIKEIIKLTSDYAGINGMIGGQTIDIESENKNISMETMKYIHENKTGKLLRLPVEAGCIIAEAQEREKEVLINYAKLIGLAFQIKDDILDVEGDFLSLGKPVGSDEKLNKSTYPSILGMEKTKLMLNETIEKAKKILIDEFGKANSKNLLKLADYIGNRKS